MEVASTVVVLHHGAKKSWKEFPRDDLVANPGGVLEELSGDEAPPCLTELFYPLMDFVLRTMARTP